MWSSPQTLEKLCQVVLASGGLLTPTDRRRRRHRCLPNVSLIFEPYFNYDFAWRFRLNEDGTYQIENAFLISGENSYITYDAGDDNILIRSRRPFPSLYHPGNWPPACTPCTRQSASTLHVGVQRNLRLARNSRTRGTAGGHPTHKTPVADACYMEDTFLWLNGTQLGCKSQRSRLASPASGMARARRAGPTTTHEPSPSTWVSPAESLATISAGCARLKTQLSAVTMRMLLDLPPRRCTSPPSPGCSTHPL